MDPCARILLVVSCYSSVNVINGGHYHSVRALADSFSKAWPASSVTVCVLGDVVPDPLLSDDVVHIDIRRGSLVEALRRFSQVVVSGEFSHIHAFDNKSYAFSRTAAIRSNIFLFLTKPGGQNPTLFFPKAHNIVCFSRENESFFAGRRRYKSSRVEFLPQRILQPQVDASRVAEIREMVGDSSVIMRIARIGPFHETSIRQTLALAAELRKSGRKIVAVVIGVAEDPRVVKEIERCAGPGDLILTADHFTHDASQLLGVADGVVGVGRTLIEAALLGLTLFAPSPEGTLPTRVTSANWRELSLSNFSARRMAGEAQDASLLALPVSGVRDAAAFEIADEYDLARAIPSYVALYMSGRRGRVRWIDLFANWISVLIPYLRLRLRGADERLKGTNS